MKLINENIVNSLPAAEVDLDGKQFTNIPILVYDADSGAILDVNSKMRRIFGYTKKAALNLNIEDLSSGISPYSLGDAIQWAALAKSGGEQIFNWHFRKKSGNIFPAKVFIRYVKSGNKIISVVHYVTKQKNSRQLNKFDGAAGHTLLQSTTLYLALLRKDGNVLMMNDTLLNVLGYKLEEVKDTEFLKTFIPAEERNILSATFKNQFKASNASTSITNITGKDGKKHLVEWLISAASDDFHPDYFIAIGTDISERKEYKDSFSRTQSNLFSLVESTDDLIWSVDPGYQISTFNTAIKMHLWKNYGREIFIGAKIEELIPQEKVSLWRSFYKKAFESGPFRVEYETNLKILELSFNPIIVNKEKIGVSVFGKDITERKNTEEALRRSEQQLKGFIEALPDLVWLKSPEGIYQNCNKKLEELFGVKESEIIVKTDYDFVEPRIADIFRMNDLRAIDEKKPVLNEEEVTYRIDGHSEILETVKTPIFTNEGELLGVLGIARDITQRKKIEEALRNSETKYKNLFYNSVIGMFLIGLNELRILDCNEKFLDIVRYTKEDLDSLNTVSLWKNPEQRAKFLHQLDTEGRVLNYECQLVTKSGEILTCLISGKLYKYERIIEGSLVDITDRKNVEHALHERLKEITCLFKVSLSIQSNPSLDNLCENILNALATAMQFPQIAVPIIEINEKIFGETSYKNVLPHGIHSDIILKGELRGKISVYYTEPKEFYKLS